MITSPRRLPCLACIAVGFMTLTAQPAVAQNPNGPAGRTFNLTEGFEPDPRSTSLEGGGHIEVSFGSCNYGHVANDPDVDLEYTTSGGSDLFIYARSTEDLMILVSMPDGSWRCNDDGLGNLDPLLTIRGAPGGWYNIWVGTMDDNRSATLYISEIDPR